MHAEPVDRKKADPLRLRGLRDVVDNEAAAIRDADAVGILLVVREQQVARELHLVRVRSPRHWNLPHDAGPREVGDLHDTRADAEVAHMAHVQHVAVPHDLHAVTLAGEIGVADELEAARLEGTR